MKKTPLLLALALLSACAPDPDKSATKEYVEAAKQTRTANALFESARFAEALKNFGQADGKIDAILEKYPSSSIALKLVSESGVKVGEFEYSALRTKIIPSLKAIASPKLAKVSTAWAIASFAKTESETAAAFERIAREVAESDKFSEDEKAEILDAVPVKITRPISMKTAAQPAKPEPKQTPQTLQKPEIDKLLAEAKSNAVYSSFSLSAAESLLEKAKIVPQQRRAEFSEILRSATAQTDKISVVSLKEKAFAILAAAAAQVGDESLTLELLAKIKNPESLEKVFVTLAANLAKTRNYAAALGTVAKIKNPQTRDEFVKNALRKRRPKRQVRYRNGSGKANIDGRRPQRSYGENSDARPRFGERGGVRCGCFEHRRFKPRLPAAISEIRARLGRKIGFKRGHGSGENPA